MLSAICIVEMFQIIKAAAKGHSVYSEDIVNAIEKIADPCWQADWDKSGLQVASTRREATCLGIFLDATPESIKNALADGADFLLSHHPLALTPGLPNCLDNWHEALRLLLGANVPLYAAHTSLDVNLNGPAGWLGRALNLRNGTPLEKIQDGNLCLGYGEVGDLPMAMDGTKIVNCILSLAKLRCAPLAGPEIPHCIRRIAYCGGSGASLLDMAKDCGADLYITGDVKYHAALETEIAVLDVGHHALEEEMMRQFAELLATALPEIQVKFFPSLSPFRFACVQGSLNESGEAHSVGATE